MQLRNSMLAHVMCRGIWALSFKFTIESTKPGHTGGVNSSALKRGCDCPRSWPISRMCSTWPVARRRTPSA